MNSKKQRQTSSSEEKKEDVNEICNLLMAQKIDKEENKKETEDKMIVEEEDFEFNEELNYLISNMSVKEKPPAFMPYIF
jgi:hypothetical protein